MAELREHVWGRFVGGWDPHQLPPTYLSPRDLGPDQVLDARGVRFTRGGSIAWRRDQFRIAKPTGAGIDEVKSVLEFKTDEYEQVLAFMAPDAVNFGNEMQGATEVEIDDRITGSWFTCGAALCYLDKITAYLRVVLTGGTPTVKAAIYRLSDLQLIAESSPVELTATGWTVFDFPEWPVLTNTNYVLVVWAEDLAGSSVYLACDVTAPGIGPYDDETFGEWPDYLVGHSEDRLYSIYATYLAIAGSMHYLDVDWSMATPEQWTYGYELFGDKTWQTASGATVPWWGPSDAAQVGEVLLLPFGRSRDMLRWDGDTLAVVGIDAPTDTPTAAEDVAPPATSYPAGTYTYFFTYYDGEFESMPSEVPSDVVPPVVGTFGQPRYLHRAGVSVVISDGNSIDVANLTDHVSGYQKKVYRAYTPDTSAGAMGADFFYIATVADGVTTYDDDEVPPYAVGDTIAFDHARPPQAAFICFHKERIWLAGAATGSEDYEGYTEGYWQNVLFFSELNQPYYYPGANTIVIGDDSPITGLASWGDYLVVFKENSVWAVRGWSDDDFRVDLITSQVGAQADSAQCAAPPGVLWQASDGYYFWNGAKIERIIEITPDSPWALIAPGSQVPTVAYHAGRFYVEQEDGWLEWEPTPGRWCYREAAMDDDSGYPAGFRAYSFGPYQTHVLTRMAWVAAGDQEITVLDAGTAFSNGDAAGDTYSGYRAPVQITLAPLEAPPGFSIVPVEVWADCEYTDDATPSRRPKLFLNTDAGYSDTAGANAWETTPDAPTAGEVIGVPPAYEYTGPGYRTNQGRRWYLQIEGESGADFVLNAVRLVYRLIRERGA